MTAAPRSLRHRQRGATLIEILVSLFILMVGLLGLVGMMVESQRAQLESYQRVQALLLVQDMAARMNANKAAAPCYVSASAYGTGNATAPNAGGCASGTTEQKARATADLVDWDNLLKGAAETTDSGATNVGGILGARGCVTRDAATGIYQVAVAWQGISNTFAPPAGITCGSGQYGGEGYRRAVSLTVLM